MTDPIATATASPPSPARPRRRGRACGSSCRPTTRPRTSARSRPPSWRRSRTRPCSWSTTSRPMAPAALADALAADRPARPGPPPGAEAGPRTRLSRWLRRRARRRCDDRRPDGRRLQPRPGGTARDGRADRRRRRADLVIGSRYTKGGGVVDWGIGRRLVSRGGSIFARIVLGLGANDLTGGFKAWRSSTLAGRPVRRRPCRRLRLPDRDDVPRQPRRRAHPRGPDHVPRSPRRAIEDEPADRGRGAGRRRPAAGRGDLPGGCAVARSGGS